MKNETPYFLWTIKKDAVDYHSLNVDQALNHYGKTASFTTKVWGGAAPWGHLTGGHLPHPPVPRAPCAPDRVPGRPCGHSDACLLVSRPSVRLGWTLALGPRGGDLVLRKGGPPSPASTVTYSYTDSDRGFPFPPTFQPHSASWKGLTPISPRAQVQRWDLPRACVYPLGRFNRGFPGNQGTVPSTDKDGTGGGQGRGPPLPP